MVKTAQETDTNLSGPKGSIIADLDFKRDTKIVLNEVIKNFDNALKIARGEVQTPAHIKVPLLIEALAQKAMKEGKIELATEMIQRRQLLGSQAGSDLKAHDVQVGFTDPVTALETVIKKQNNRKIKGKKVSEVKKEYSKEFDQRTKGEITQESIIDFINSIEC
jgi:hypothetical protein